MLDSDRLRADTRPHAVVCDLVRREDSGKFILIGVYSASILVPKFPSKLRLAAFVEFYPPAKSFELELRYADRHGKIFAGASAHVEATELEPMSSVAIPGLPLEFSEQTVLRLEMKINDGEWQLLRLLPVLLKGESVV